MYNTYTNASTTQSIPSIAEMQRMAERFDRERKKSLGPIADFQCKTCGRKVTVVSRGHGDTLVVCRHILDELEKLPKAEHKPDVFGCGVRPIHGFAIEVLDDGPLRW